MDRREVFRVKKRQDERVTATCKELVEFSCTCDACT